MIEPVPGKISPPPSAPLMRVGVVLPEDNKDTLRISVSKLGYSLRSGDEIIKLSPGQIFNVSIAEQGLQVTLSDGDRIFSGPISVIPSPDITISPKSGIAVEGIRAGRGFHWQKELTEIFSGELELHRIQNRIVAVSVVPFEEYIASVTSSEMSPNAPAECAKAQAIVARSWSLVFLGEKHTGMPFTICNDDDCQRYQGTTHLLPQSLDAVRATSGEILIGAGGFITPAYYSKCCGGKSETPENCFGFSAEGLSAVWDGPGSLEQSENLSDQEAFSSFMKIENPNIYCAPGFVPPNELEKYLGAVDEKGRYFRWTQKISAKDLIDNLRTKFKLADIRSISAIKFGTRGVSGRFLSMTVEWRDIGGKSEELHLSSQYEIRRALDKAFLKSSAFTARMRFDRSQLSSIELEGLGWGHGVGLCQIGSLGMALSGCTYKEILKHYFPLSRLSGIDKGAKKSPKFFA